MLRYSRCGKHQTAKTHPYYVAMYMLLNGRWMKKSEVRECGLMAEVMSDELALGAGQQPITTAS